MKFMKVPVPPQQPALGHYHYLRLLRALAPSWPIVLPPPTNSRAKSAPGTRPAMSCVRKTAAPEICGWPWASPVKGVDRGDRPIAPAAGARLAQPADISAAPACRTINCFAAKEFPLSNDTICRLKSAACAVGRGCIGTRRQAARAVVSAAQARITPEPTPPLNVNCTHSALPSHAAGTAALLFSAASRRAAITEPHRRAPGRCGSARTCQHPAHADLNDARSGTRYRRTSSPGCGRSGSPRGSSPRSRSNRRRGSRGTSQSEVPSDYCSANSNSR